MLKHSIENNKQLPHASGKSHLFRLPNRTEVLIERLDNRIVACGYQGSHVQRCSDCSSPSPHCTLTSQSPTITVKRGDTYQGSYLFLIQFTKLLVSPDNCSGFFYIRVATSLSYGLPRPRGNRSATPLPIILHLNQDTRGGVLEGEVLP